MTRNKLLGAGLALALSTVAANAATTVFFEDFAEELASISPANQANNFAALDSFTITDGTVDLFGNGGFSLSCPSTGCLDLDGSSVTAAKIESDAISLVNGDSYTLSFVIGGSQRGQTNTVDVGVDFTGGATENFAPVTLDGNDPYQTVSYGFAAAGTSGSIFFDQQGDDNVGLLLDSVTLTHNTPAVPVPATLPLLLAGVAGFGALRRVRR